MLHLTQNEAGHYFFVVTAEDDTTILARFAPAATQDAAIDVLRLALAELETAIAAGQALRQHDAGDAGPAA